MRLSKKIRLFNTVLSLFALLLNIVQPFALAAISSSFAQSAYAEDTVVESTPAPESTPTEVVEPSTTPEVTPEATTETASEVTPEESTEPEASPSITPDPSIAPDETVDESPEPSNSPDNTVDESIDTVNSSTPENSTSNDETTPPVELTANVVNSTNTSVDESFDFAATEVSSATIFTDRPDYSPTDTALISASDLLPLTTYEVKISSSDPPEISHTDSVKTDDTGLLTYSYTLDGTYRPNYLVEIFLGSSLIATTTFTDTQPNTVTICHSTSSQTNPYVVEHPAISGDVSGHDGHDGGVYPTDPWGDIIPPFTYQEWEVTGSHLGCPNGYSGVSTLHPGYCYKNNRNFDWPEDYALMVSIDDYGWVDHNYSGKNWTSEGQEIWNNGCEVPPPPTACDTPITYEKTSDFSNSEVYINFKNSDYSITVHPGTGYEVVNVWLDVENDGYGGYHLYATGPVTDFNPPGWKINKAKVEVVMPCPDTTGSLSVHKFNDKDRDGTQDAGEGNLDGIVMKLYEGDSCTGNFVTQCTTNGSGNCSLGDQTSGNYSVEETLPTGWNNSTPVCQNVSLNSGDDKTLNFGNYELTGFFKIYKFDDLNADGLRQVGDGELYLRDWTINVTGPDGYNESANTNNTGSWYAMFSKLDYGTYTFSEVQQNGWVETIPSSGRNYTCVISSVNSQCTGYVSNFKLGEISGTKFNDLNGDGDRDAGEPGLAGWTIELDTNADDSVDDTTLTDADGKYEFSGLAYGTYRVREQGQTGWTQTTTNPSDLLIESGSYYPDIDFGNQQGPVTVVAKKVVCDSEEYLPNWGNHGAVIGETTAADYVAAHSEHCRLENQWQFQWAPSGGDYGSFQTDTSLLGDPWITFTAASPAVIDYSDITNNRIEMREVESYGPMVPFSNDPGNVGSSVSSEFYCQGDVYNYDNWEWINNPELKGIFSW